MAEAKNPSLHRRYRDVRHIRLRPRPVPVVFALANLHYIANGDFPFLGFVGDAPDAGGDHQNLVAFVGMPAGSGAPLELETQEIRYGRKILRILYLPTVSIGIKGTSLGRDKQLKIASELMQGTCAKCRQYSMNLDSRQGFCPKCQMIAPPQPAKPVSREAGEKALADRIGGTCRVCKFSVQSDRLRCHRWPPKPIQRGMARAIIGTLRRGLSGGNFRRLGQIRPAANLRRGSNGLWAVSP